MRRPRSRPRLLAAGVVLRPVALPLEVAAFTRDARWLRDAWAPPALFVLTLAASCVASVTTRRATLQFKGPRRAG